MTVLVIDNYDSFTYNLVHYIGELGAKLAVRRNDKISVDEVMAMDPEAIVLSPGPCTPNEAGICLDLIARAAPGNPDLRRLPRPSVDRPGLRRRDRARALPDARQGLDHQPQRPRRLPRHQPPFQATRYHSLTIAPETVPDVLEVTATAEDGVIMGAMHKHYPVHGVQFHPEFDRLRARPPDPQEFPRHRRRLERKTPRGEVGRLVRAMLQ